MKRMQGLMLIVVFSMNANVGRSVIGHESCEIKVHDPEVFIQTLLPILIKKKKAERHMSRLESKLFKEARKGFSEALLSNNLAKALNEKGYKVNFYDHRETRYLAQTTAGMTSQSTERKTRRLSIAPITEDHPKLKLQIGLNFGFTPAVDNNSRRMTWYLDLFDALAADNDPYRQKERNYSHYMDLLNFDPQNISAGFNKALEELPRCEILVPSSSEEEPQGCSSETHTVPEVVNEDI